MRNKICAKSVKKGFLKSPIKAETKLIIPRAEREDRSGG